MERELLIKKFAADDWGITPHINESIIILAAANLLHSISLVSNAPYLNYKLEYQNHSVASFFIKGIASEWPTIIGISDVLVISTK